MKNVKISDELYKIMTNLIEFRRNQDNFGTATPVYLVQTRIEEFCDEESSEVERLYISELDYDVLPTLEDIKDGALDEELPEDIANEVKQQETMDDVVMYLSNKGYDYDIFHFKYVWKTVAYFLSLKEAEDYQQYQSHNLGISRVYADYVGYRNGGSFAQLLRLLDSDLELIKED